ncbi:MAG: type II CRISPR-associated endonuclease Cas1 [Methyloprofundus sp.]|nr:type II CRISPR-associated endonuclease Cas1 [Methyloprofundus sp.]
MIKRTLEISHPSYLKSHQAQLVIEQDHQQVGQVAFEDLGVLILAHPQITLTQAVLEACAQVNCVIVHCDHRHIPISLTLPLASHSLHSKIIQQQIQITPVRRKQLWQQIVREKIIQQAQTLQNLNINTQVLTRLVGQVQSGDKTNIEAQAAQKYWKLLLGQDFRRDPDLDGVNSLLNYGYAIIRATIARALVGTGFHPAIGLNHTNQYNAYCLADDVMEPFRPWVDQQVVCFESDQINQQSKAALLNQLNQTVVFQQKSQPFLVALSLFVAQLKSAYTDNEVVLTFPRRG